MTQKMKLEEIVEPLVKWYRENKRELPWRADKIPYHVWVSEIMLQQTRIEAVKKYYQKFMNELPDIQSLSNIEEEKLLKLWEGLGYYSRAKNLKKAASIIMQEYHGTMPTQYEELKKLPGIGDYTAGAIASICYNEKVTAVDGNVLRIVARITGNNNNILLPETKKEMTAQIQKILPSQAGDFNQGLMELGELVCLPNGNPLCHNCPIQSICTAFQENLTSEIPVRIKNMKRKTEEKTVLVLLSHDHKIAIEKRNEPGLLAGMYQLPNVEGFCSEKELYSILKQKKIHASDILFLKNEKHVFTHIDWYMKAYFMKVTQKSHDFLWVSLEELAKKYPMPTAFQKITRWLPIT